MGQRGAKHCVLDLDLVIFGWRCGPKGVRGDPTHWTLGVRDDGFCGVRWCFGGRVMWRWFQIGPVPCIIAGSTFWPRCALHWWLGRVVCVEVWQVEWVLMGWFRCVKALILCNTRGDLTARAYIQWRDGSISNQEVEGLDLGWAWMGGFDEELN